MTPITVACLVAIPWILWYWSRTEICKLELRIRELEEILDDLLTGKKK